MFKLSEQFLENIKSALAPAWEPAFEGPQYMATCNTCIGSCKNSCKGACKGSCQGGCTRSCKGHSR